MKPPMTVKEVLQGALKLIEGGWVRGRMFKRRGDRVCYCAAGAINQAAGSQAGLIGGARYAFRHAAHAWSVVGYNDATGRKKSEVVAAFKRAIAEVAA